MLCTETYTAFALLFATLYQCALFFFASIFCASKTHKSHILWATKRRKASVHFRFSDPSLGLFVIVLRFQLRSFHVPHFFFSNDPFFDALCSNLRRQQQQYIQCICERSCSCSCVALILLSSLI